MKIRCGSHQQNRSIVRPGLSLMATKVALTAEEFRENSQRSIDLFNTEKLSTDSTRVLKSVYCNSVHFCRCNLRGACGGKGFVSTAFADAALLQSARSVWRQRPDSTAYKSLQISRLQSARSVWRQRITPPTSPMAQSRGCNLRGACGGKDNNSLGGFGNRNGRCNLRGACGGKARSGQSKYSPAMLQSARSVWRQRQTDCIRKNLAKRCNLRGACGGKGLRRPTP